MNFAEIHLEVTCLGNALGIFQSLGEVGEKLCHLLGALEVEKVPCHLQPFIIMDGGVSLNANEQVVRGGILLVYIVDIARSYNRYIQLGTERKKMLVDLLQFRNGVSLNLQVIISKDLFI